MVLQLAMALTRTPSEVSDDLFAALRFEFSERELVELSSAIAWENYRARFNRTFAIESEGFSEDQFCPLLEGGDATLKQTRQDGFPLNSATLDIQKVFPIGARSRMVGQPDSYSETGFEEVVQIGNGKSAWHHIFSQQRGLVA